MNQKRIRQSVSGFFEVGKGIPLLIALLLFSADFMPTAIAQLITSDEDYDILVVPVGGTKNVSGKDFSGDTLESMGFTVIAAPDPNHPKVGELTAGKDRLVIHLHSDESVQLWSAPIPVSATSILFSCSATVTGNPPTQAALAFIDGKYDSNLGVSLSLNDEIPLLHDGDFSFEYQCRSEQVILLLQWVGPQQGESWITLERPRILSGYRELDYTLGSAALSFTEHFGGGIQQTVKNTPPTSAGGYTDVSHENRMVFPNFAEQSLLLGTQGKDDVIQVSVPVAQLDPLIPKPGAYPLQIYGQAYVKRLYGDNGLFSVALFSGNTGSGGYTNYPVASLPMDEWFRVESPVRFSEKGAGNPQLILQIQGGDTQIAVDDVSLQARRDSEFFWDAGVYSVAAPPLIPGVTIPTGTFLRGSKLIADGGEVDPNHPGSLDELPQREINVSPFIADRYEVSNDLYYKFWFDPQGGNGVNYTPIGQDSFNETWPYCDFKHPQHPVVNITWEDAMAFCRWRTQAEHIPPPYAYRLPTEAEWEYMARGLTRPGEKPNTYPWGFTDPETSPTSLANYHGTVYFVGHTTPITDYEAGKSPLGILNLAGNVWEWCLDCYDENYYTNSPSQDPMGPPGSDQDGHVIRGGSWKDSTDDMRAANRAIANVETLTVIGFRCVLSTIPIR